MAKPDPARPDREAADIVEEASAESLPASDPPAWTPVEGERAADPAELRSEAEQRDRAALKDRLLRALAELENFRRRAERERAEAVRFAAAEIVKDLLPTADNLAGALASVPPDRTADAEAMRQLLAGVAATERALQDALARHGIRKIEPAAGEPLDPHRHQALFEVETADYPAGAVVQVLVPGYAYYDRLLRPALVGVAKPHVAPEA